MTNAFRDLHQGRFPQYVGKISNGYEHTRGRRADLAKDRICKDALVVFFASELDELGKKIYSNVTVPSPLKDVLATLARCYPHYDIGWSMWIASRAKRPRTFVKSCILGARRHA